MNVLLSGASRGLGLTIARQQLERGHTLFVVNRTLSDELIELKSIYSTNLASLQIDLTDSDTLKQQVFDNLIGVDTPIHAIINNAASAYDDLVTNLMLDPLEKMFRVNVFTPMLLTKYAIRQMLLHKTHGSIVHISSISAHTGYKGLAMYASTKGAIEAFSKNVAREWGSYGIRSNCVVAGFMETSMSSTLSSEQKDRIFNRTSLRSATSLESVARTVDFLLSEDSKSITGQNIFVDSGAI